MRLAIGVMGHPARAAHVARMCERLPGLLVTIDPEPDAPGCWACARLAWQRLLDTGASHLLLLQDDVGFCADLPGAALAVARARPESPIALYTHRDAVRRAAAAGLRWAELAGFVHGVAVLAPASLIAAFLSWESTAADPGYWAGHDDARFSDFLTAHRIRAYATVPSLVDHLGDGERTPSLLSHGWTEEHRRSVVYAGDGAEAAGLGWDDLRAAT